MASGRSLQVSMLMLEDTESQLLRGKSIKRRPLIHLSKHHTRGTSLEGNGD